MEKLEIGNLKIINILDFPKMENNLQKNLLEIHEIVGKQFIIKFNSHLIIAAFYKNKNFTNEREFFRLYYEGEIIDGKIVKRKNTIYNLYPFIIDFIDPITVELNDHAYISTIHKTDNISGSEMVEIVKKINEIFGVKKVYLHDKAIIECHGGHTLSLSLFKLIEKGRTFYSKFGFDFDVNNINNFYMNKFDSVDQLKNKVDFLVNQIKGIKTKTLIQFVEDIMDIIDLVVRNNDYENLIIKKTLNVLKDTRTDLYEISNPKDSIKDLFDKLINMLHILKDVKQEYFYQYLIEVFNDPNKNIKYKEMIDFLTLDNIYLIKYHNKEVTNDFDFYFKNLNVIKKDHYYVYKF